MKYIRTKDDVYKIILVSPLGFVRIDKRDGTYPDVFEKDILKQADTIEELCDEFIGVGKANEHDKLNGSSLKSYCNYVDIYSAIWTDKGLIYVAKMNDKGELELL